MPSSHSLLRSLQRNAAIISISALVLACIVSMGFYFFVRGERLMEGQLKDRLRSMAAMAAEQFDPATIQRITGPESMRLPEFSAIVTRLRVIRQDIPEIRFAYIMRRTDDPRHLSFVADADSLSTPHQLDRNDNGIVEQDEAASFPGDLYDISDVPALQDRAFREATVDPAITHDQWGDLLSGYAPIRDAGGHTIAVLGIDMDAREFVALSRTVFSPVAFLLLCLVGFLIALLMAAFLWRRRMESLRRIDQERSGLMLLTSHQLGSPLTIFRWSLEELLEHSGKASLERAVQEHAKNVQHGIDQLVAIFDELQDASQVDRGTLAYNGEMASLHEVLARVVSSLSGELHQSGQRVTQTVDRSLQLRLDRKLIEGVLRELLHNAITFSPGGSVIELVAKRGGKCVLVEVIDRGCGISKDDLPRVFDKFTRGSSAHLYQPNGSGLGLYIAKGIIERAGGDIWIKSVEGKGTTVTFTLPC